MLGAYVKPALVGAVVTGIIDGEDEEGSIVGKRLVGLDEGTVVGALVGIYVYPATVGVNVFKAVMLTVKIGPLTILEPITLTKFVFELIKAPTSIPKKQYASPVAELI